MQISTVDPRGIEMTITVSDTLLEERVGHPLTEEERLTVQLMLIHTTDSEVRALLSMHLTGESLHSLFNPEAAAAPSLFESLTDEQIAEMRGEQTDNWIEPDIGPDLDSNDSTEEVK